MSFIKTLYKKHSKIIVIYLFLQYLLIKDVNKYCKNMSSGLNEKITL